MKKTILLAVFTFLAAISVSMLTSRVYPPALEEEIKIVPQLPISEILSLDHRGFLADIYFIQVSLHSGSLMWKPLKFQFDSEWAYKMMDVITDLDPGYYTAYLFSGMGLIHNFDDVKRAKPIMEKGMAVFPDSWELPFWIGYDHYVYFDDTETAAKYLWQAFQKPGAPTRFLSLMLSALKRTGDYEKAAQAMKVLMDEAQDENLKLIYAKKLVQLENLVGLQKAAMFFKEKTGRLPEDIDEMVTSGLIKEIPADPLGQEYIIDREKQRVVLKPAENQKGAEQG